MWKIFNGRAKYLLISLLSISALGGCAAYGPADPYGSYPVDPYGQGYYGPQVYYGPDAEFGYGYYGDGHDHDWYDDHGGRDSNGNDGKPSADNGFPQARHGMSGLRDRASSNAGDNNQGDARGGRGGH